MKTYTQRPIAIYGHSYVTSVIAHTPFLRRVDIHFFFRSLRNSRTRIHKNLFVAMVIQVVIRLTLYIDQAVIRGASSDRYSPGTTSHHRQGIDNTVSRQTINEVALSVVRHLYGVF